jgi:hypothetical protein
VSGKVSSERILILAKTIWADFNADIFVPAKISLQLRSLIQKSPDHTHRDATYNTEQWARNEKLVESLPASCERIRLARTFRLDITSMNSSRTRRTTSSQDETKYYWRKARQANAEERLRKKVGLVQ